jgi:hypothetical protein
MSDKLLSEAPATGPEATPSPVRTPHKSLVALRIIAVAHLIVFFLQPVLAGIYLSGDFDALGLHDLNAQILSGFTAAQLIGCLIYAWRGGGRWWPLIFTVVLVLLEESQKGLGYNQLVALHIPVGVLLIMTQLIFTGWTFTGCAKVARVRRGERS